MFRILIYSAIFLKVTALCPGGSLEWQKSCFFFEANATEFGAAEIKCVAKNGSHLVSIHDAFTNDILAQESADYFHQSSVNDFWIGLTNLMPSGNWP